MKQGSPGPPGPGTISFLPIPGKCPQVPGATVSTRSVSVLCRHVAFLHPFPWWLHTGPLCPFWFSLQGKYPEARGFPGRVAQSQEGDYRPHPGKGAKPTSESCGHGEQPGLLWPGKRTVHSRIYRDNLKQAKACCGGEWTNKCSEWRIPGGMGAHSFYFTLAFASFPLSGSP